LPDQARSSRTSKATIGIDITPVIAQGGPMPRGQRYVGKRKISWVEIFAGDRRRTLRHEFPD